MKYFPIPDPIEVPDIHGKMQKLSYQEYLELPSGDHARAPQHTVWSHPRWRESAENAEHFVTARQAIKRAKKYGAMSDEAFEVFKPLALRAGQDLNPDLMPLATCVLKATSTKPEDYDATQAQPAEAASAN